VGLAETEASLRYNLVQQLARAEADLRALIERLGTAGDSAVTQDAQQQLTALRALRSQVATAGLLDLISLRSDVAATVSTASSVVAQGQGVADRAAAADRLAHADDEARRSVAGFMDDYYKKKIFDPYLRFSSDEDRDAFRERERERQEAIARAQDQHTPEGNLEAIRLSAEQLKDAGAHGADRSSDYAPMLARLTADKQALATQVDAAAKNKQAADQLAILNSDPQDAPIVGNLTTNLIAQLKRAGMTSSDGASEGHGLSTTLVSTSTGPIPG
jgi:hypothetical protein